MEKDKFGTVVRKARGEADMSLRECARSLHVSASYLSDVELNRCNPTLKLVVRVSDVLRINFVPLLRHAPNAKINVGEVLTAFECIRYGFQTSGSIDTAIDAGLWSLREAERKERNGQEAEDN